MAHSTPSTSAVVQRANRMKVDTRYVCTGMAGDPIHTARQKAYAISSLLDESSTSTIPKTKGGGKGEFARKNVVTRQLFCVIPKEGVTNPVIMAVAELSYMRMIFGTTDDQIGGMLSILSCMMPSLLRDTTIISACEDCAIEIKHVFVRDMDNLLCSVSAMTLEERQILNDSYGAERVDAAIPTAVVVLSKLPQDTDLIGACSNITYTYALSGVLMSLMGKILTDANYGPWVTKRWAAFCGALGVPASGENLFNNVRLPLSVLAGIGQFFASSQPLRRRLLQIILDINSAEGLATIVTQNVTKYLKWTEMGHIGLINKYIFKFHPQLLFMKELRPYLDEYVKALKALADSTNDPALWPYAKILSRKDNTEFLSRHKFQLLTTIALEIGKTHHSTLGNYQGATTDLASELLALKNKAVRLAWATRDLPLPEDMTAEVIESVLETHLGQNILLEQEVLVENPS